MKKKSFDPIIGKQPKVIILGSLPGEKSLELQQYYGFPQNRFWKIMFKFFNQDFSDNYQTRINLIQNNLMILWDVAYSAERKGSLDSAINNEEPNDIESIINQYPTIKLIIFNGKKSEQIYKRFFKPIENIKNVALPSTSPANAGYTFDRLYQLWYETLSQYLK